MLAATDIIFSPILDTSTNQLTGNSGKDLQKSTYDGANKTLTIAIGSGDNLILENKKNSTNNDTYRWYQKLSDDLDTELQKNPDFKWNLTINAPNSTMTLKSDAALGESPKIGEGAEIKITAKEIKVGDGTQSYPDLFGEKNTPSMLAVMKQESSIKADVLVNKDGIFGVASLNNSLTNFILEGNLTINGGGLQFGAIDGGKNPDFNVNGKVSIKDAQIRTILNVNGSIGDLKIVGSRDGISLSGRNQIEIAANYFLQDFVDIDKNHVDYGYAKQIAVDLYSYTLKVENKTLYASPELSRSAKETGVVKLIEDAKNKIAKSFYDDTEGSYDRNNCSASSDQKKCLDYKSVMDILGNYLAQQGVPTTNLLSGADIPSRVNAANVPISISNLENIDARLELIKNGANNALAESIKNSNNNYLAVNFVNALMQGSNNASINLIDEAKSNVLFLASAPSLIGNEIHTSLALISRYANFSFASRILPLEDQNSQVDSLQVTPKSIDPLLSNSLWANAFGGANLLGSGLGASYGFNFGYDKSFQTALLGTYLSYEYASFSPERVILNSHNVKLGVYSRIENESNEVDLEFNTLLSSISEESRTTVIPSKSNANFLSYLAGFKTTYGYVFLQEDFRFKPLLGLSLSFSYTPSFKENGDVVKNFSSQNNFNANFSAGMEFRRIFLNKGFFYSILSVEQDLFNSQKSIKIDSQILSAERALKTYVKILLGGKIMVNNDWDIALSLGVKQSIVGEKYLQNKAMNETYINGNVGVGYRF